MQNQLTERGALVCARMTLLPHCTLFDLHGVKVASFLSLLPHLEQAGRQSERLLTCHGNDMIFINLPCLVSHDTAYS